MTADERFDQLPARDYAAIKAMQGIISTMSESNNVRGFIETAKKDNMNATQAVAVLAYQFADAMIAESEKTK